MVGEEVGPCSSVLHEILFFNNIFFFSSPTCRFNKSREHMRTRDVSKMSQFVCRDFSEVKTHQTDAWQQPAGSFDSDDLRHVVERDDLVVVSFIASPGQVPHRVTESVRALGTWSLGEMVSEWRDCVLGCALKWSTLFRSGMLRYVVPCCAMLSGH